MPKITILVFTAGTMFLLSAQANEKRHVEVSLEGPYQAAVDYNLTTAQLYKSGRYNNENRFTDDGEKRRGIEHVDFYLAAPSMDLNWLLDNELISSIFAEGMKPASVRELLAFGIAHPQEQLKFEIIALNEKELVAGVCSEREAPELYSSYTQPILGDAGPAYKPQLPVFSERKSKGPVERFFGYHQISPNYGCSHYFVRKFPKERTRILVRKAR